MSAPDTEGTDRFGPMIAGWFARQIHPYIEEGDVISKGDRIGHISFESRADVILPSRFTEANLAVEAGDTVYAGQTMISFDPDEESVPDETSVPEGG